MGSCIAVTCFYQRNTNSYFPTGNHSKKPGGYCYTISASNADCRPKKYNAAQRLAYTGVIFMGLGSLLTGLAIYKPVQLYWLCAMLGGYEWARAEHFILTILFALFFLLHIIQVLLAGWNNFAAMIRGFETKKSPRRPNLLLKKNRLQWNLSPKTQKHENARRKNSGFSNNPPPHADCFCRLCHFYRGLPVWLDMAAGATQRGRRPAPSPQRA